MVYICHNALSDSVMQPIRVETAAGQVHTAVMHTVDMDTSIEDIRMTAMYVRSPIHTLMFSSKGALLGANSSALEACHVHTAGGKVMTVFQTHPDSLRTASKHILFGCSGTVVTFVKQCAQQRMHMDSRCMAAHALHISCTYFASLQ